MRSGPSHSSYRRAGTAYRPTGSVAPYRHPRAGTGSGSYYYHGGYNGHYGGYYGGYYGGHYGRYYRPYYPYYGGYYSPYFYGSVYLGWPYYSSWPYYSGGYYAGGDYTTSYTYAPSYYSGEGEPAPDSYEVAPAPAPRVQYEGRSSAAPRDSGQLRLEVRPEDASVYVDDQFRGTAREARLLNLPPGRHTIELVRPGFAVERREVEITNGERSDLLVELQRP